MDYHVRQYQPGDEEEIVELLELVFDGWPKFDLNCSPLDHWKWKYLDNLFKKESNAVAVINNRIVGCNHGYYVNVKVGGNTLFCQHGGDLAVHPDYRRMGIRNKMREIKVARYTAENCDMTYSVTSNPIVIKGSIKRGHPQFPHPILQLIRIEDVDLHFKHGIFERKWMKKTGFTLLRALNKLRNLVNTSHSDPELKIKEIRSFDSRMDFFWAAIKEHYMFIVERNNDYLNWRYCDPRGGDYIIRTIEERGDIIGFSVLRINRFNEKYFQGHIVELLTLPDRLDVVEALVYDAVHYFDDQSVNVIYYWIPKNHPYEKVLKKFGFLDSRHNVFFVYRPKRKGEEFKEIRNAPVNRVFVQKGDVDGI